MSISSLIGQKPDTTAGDWNGDSRRNRSRRLAAAARRATSPRLSRLASMAARKARLLSIRVILRLPEFEWGGSTMGRSS